MASARGQAMALPTIPEDILAEIFLRLPTPCDVISVCVSFRHIVADRSFLRRFRKLHAPPLLGFLTEQRFEKLRQFHPTTVLYPSRSLAANKIALAADLSFRFLPAGDWAVRDIRDGRVLLLGSSTHGGGPLSDDIVVCDPLHRRHLLLPPIPDDLVALVKSASSIKRRRAYGTFLLPPPDNDDDEENTSFRAIWMAMCDSKLVTFVFSSSQEQWRAGPSRSCSDLFPGSFMIVQDSSFFSRRHYANGCFYWLIDWRDKLLVFDTRRMEFSSVDGPPGTRGFGWGDMAIVEEEEDTSGIFMRASETSYHKYTFRWNSDGSHSQCDMVKTMSLDSEYFYLGSVRRRYVLLYKYGTVGPLDAGCFSLDIKTFQLERVCASKPSMPGISCIHIYCNFPPSLLSTPTVTSGAQEGAEKAMLERGVPVS
ncbi:hypothetical protein ACQ4PT_033710 [Festuca glaucescens]